MSGYKTPMTIREAVSKIKKNELLLPAIQRKFIWGVDQVTMLFDSIMCKYPINSLMFWNVTDVNIKKGYKFYSFLSKYRQFFAEDNMDFSTADSLHDFLAVIDGQQRLASLYIGLCGTYAYKMPYRHRVDDEWNLPTRKLYLNISEPLNMDTDNTKKYNFRFLTNDEYISYQDSGKGIWFEVGNILLFRDSPEVYQYITDNGLGTNRFAQETLLLLYERVCKDLLINYYEEDSQEPDKVLEIFLRTNSGGTPLSFSDLLMSISSANWETHDARHEMAQLIKEVMAIGPGGFVINQDFILKTSLCLLGGDVKFRLENFKKEKVREIDDNWDDIRTAIKSAFELFNLLGLNDKLFRAKNAAIPVIMYIYDNNLASVISKDKYDRDDKSRIYVYLMTSFVKGVFGGQTDTVLTKMRNAVRNAQRGKGFPYGAIAEAFKDDANHNYQMDDAFIDEVLNAQKGSNEAFYILSLLYPQRTFDTTTPHEDHMHPASFFQNKDRVDSKVPEDDREFAKNPENWNSVLNLQLLSANDNTSKQDEPLSDWVVATKRSPADLYIDPSTSLDVKDFRSFIESRRRNLHATLKNMINNF